MKSSTPAQLAQQKLATSGLDPAALKVLGMDVLDARAMGKLWPNFPVPALKLNYYDLDGKLRKGIYRVRLLATPVQAFGGESKIRYLQLPNTPPAAYFPRNEKWRAIADDPDQLLIITEGELKAASGSKHGFPSIGLGGVWSWRSKVYGWDLLPELEQINWKKRRVYIVFDSDASTNPDIASATAHLARTLRDRGALVAVPKLPDVFHDGRKTGLDDFLVEIGRTEGEDAACSAIDQLLDNTDADAMADHMWLYNARFALVRNPPCVLLEADDRERHAFGDWQKIYSNEKAAVMKGSGESAKVGYEPIPKYWIEWAHRRTLAALVYEPGQPRIVGQNWNEWRGLACEPEKGDVSPWRELLDQLFIDTPPWMRQWFERWCLFPVKHLGVKMSSSAIIWSSAEGIGKSNVGETLVRIYGKGGNASIISQADLDSDFNPWAARKQFVMVDDVSPHANRKKADTLKKMITQEHVTINEKNVKQYDVRDCINYYITSNHANCIHLTHEDRRYFIHNARNTKPTEEWFKKFYAWRNGPGPGALLYYALNEFDFGDFKPYDPAPMTMAKSAMTDSSRDEIESWLDQVRDAPDELLRMGRAKLDRDLFTPAEIAMMYEQQNNGQKCSASRMGIALQQNFARITVERVRINGVAERLYIMRNEKKWARATAKMCVEHVEKAKSFEQKGKKEKF